MMTSNAKMLASRNARRTRVFTVESNIAARARATTILMSLQRLSSGTVSTAEMRAAPGQGANANSPYGYGKANRRGQRGAVPYGDPAIINAQTGRFLRGWQTTITATFDGHTIIAWNRSPEAKFLAGTTKMIRRPIIERMHQLEDQGFTTAFRKALQKALQTR